MIARDEDGKFSSYAWPGGYPVYHITRECECLCPECANEGASKIAESDINWEDTNLFCDGCSKRIESAYAEEE